MDPKTREVLLERKLGKKIFAEGIAVAPVVSQNSANDTNKAQSTEDTNKSTAQHFRLYMLTWQTKEMLVLNPDTLDHLWTSKFSTHGGEGWGLSYVPYIRTNWSVVYLCRWCQVSDVC